MRAIAISRNLLVVALLMVTVAYLAGCGTQDPEESPAPVAVDDPPEPDVPEAEEATETETPPDTAQAPVVEEPALTADDLVGSVWQAGPLLLAFEEDGRLILNETEEGTWSLDGPQLTVAAAGYAYTIEIRGEGMYYGDMALRRAE